MGHGRGRRHVCPAPLGARGGRGGGPLGPLGCRERRVRTPLKRSAAVADQATCREEPVRLRAARWYEWRRYCRGLCGKVRAVVPYVEREPRYPSVGEGADERVFGAQVRRRLDGGQGNLLSRRRCSGAKLASPARSGRERSAGTSEGYLAHREARVSRTSGSGSAQTRGQKRRPNLLFIPANSPASPAEFPPTF